MHRAPGSVQHFYRQHRDTLLPPPPFRDDLTTAEAIQEQSGLHYLPIRLPFPFPHQEMLAEAMKLKVTFTPHRTHEGSVGWKSLCLHGLSSVHTQSMGVYGFNPGDYEMHWTDICRFCPVTTEVFRDLFGYKVYERLRFMLLEPGGSVIPHSDSQVDHLFPCNIALNNPPGCEFVMEGKGVLPFDPGQVNLISVSRRHIVWNQSREDRYHIIVNGTRDLEGGHWKQSIPESYRALYGR